MANARSQPKYEEATQSNDTHAYHSPDDVANLHTTLVHTLADVAGTDVTDIERSLYERIDPDALDRIFDDGGDGTHPPSHLAFTVIGYRVTVYSTGDIVVTPPADAQ